jgi:hypothetical protein
LALGGGGGGGSDGKELVPLRTYPGIKRWTFHPL